MEQMLLPLLMFAALGAMMYFGMRKQKRQAAEQQAMQSALVPGTRVMTTSGLYAEVTAVADDTIELEIAPGVRTSWVRAAVREVVVPGDASSLEELEADDTEDSEYGEYGDYDQDYDSADTGDGADAEEVSLDKRQPGKDFG